MSDQSMDTYVYVRRAGRGSTIRGDREFTAIGQRIQLPEDSYRELVVGGGAFISLADFEEIEFEPTDLIKYGNGYYGELPPEFTAKCDIAEDKFRAIYASFMSELAQ